MERSFGQGGLLWRVLAAWGDLRGSLRRELEREPREGRLVLYAMLSGAVWWVGEVMMLRYGPVPLEEGAFLGRASAMLGAALFVRTLALYVLAALLHAVARALGGTGDWRASRAAFFWAALVAAPVMVAADLAALLTADDPATVKSLAGAAGALVFAWATAACIAEAHRFASVWRGWAAVAAMAVLLLAAVAVLTLALPKALSAGSAVV